MMSFRPLFSILLAVVAAWSSTSYYVDYGRTSNGTGTAASPWKAWSNVNWVTVGTALGSGDVYLILSSRATNVGAEAIGASHGTNWLRVIGDSMYNLAATGTAAWVIDSTGAKSGLTDGGANGIYIDTGQSHIQVKGIHLIKPTWGGINLGQYNPTRHIHDILIQKCVIDTPANNHGIWFGYAEFGCYNIEVDSCTIRGTPLEAIYMGHYSYLQDSLRGVRIIGNTVIGCGTSVEGDIDIKPPCIGAVVLGNTSTNCRGHSGICIASDSATVAYNKITNYRSNVGAGDGFGISLSGDGADGTGKAIHAAWVYGNAISSTEGPGLRAFATTSTSGANMSGIRIIRNTVCNCQYGFLATVGGGKTLAIDSLYSNIFANDTTFEVQLDDAGSTITRADRNLYFRASGNSWEYHGGAKTWAQWKAAGFDTNGVQNSDPKFVSISDFHLQTTSPAINAGGSLGLPYSIDADGHVAVGALDIGAYEHAAVTSNTTLRPRIGLLAPYAHKCYAQRMFR